MKRVFKIIRRVTLGLVLSFAAFAGIDMGVRLLSQESKPLSADQEKKAKAVFGNTIDYSKVRIAFGKVSYFQSPGTVVVIGNTIHYPPPPEPKKTKDDKKNPDSKPSEPKPPVITIGYAPTPKAESDLFIHEMTHVWQNQHNIKGTGVTGAVTLWAKNLFSSQHENIYSYTLDSKKTLVDYNIEQQAEIVATYSAMKKNIARHPDRAVPREWALLKKTVEQYIPPAKPHKKPAVRPGV
ncbi:MAG: hypothetical protein K8R48_07230 [Alphaproteobacteria bacterium]|nr:hypothetical protein [Alphaproteobacteria bacterium]